MGDRYPIGAHRLVGGGGSSLLVRPDGEIDWWCTPRLDSPPLLWSLLDPQGAAARWRGARATEWDRSPAGVTARRTVSIDGRRFECWDGLVVDPGTPGSAAAVLVRLVRSLDGPAEVVHELAGGGFDREWASWAGDGWRATLGGLGLWVAGAAAGTAGSVEGRWVTHPVAVTENWTGLAIGLGPTVATFDPARAVQSLRAAEQVDEDRFEGAHLPARHPERARDALAVLAACTEPATGATVASVTTSVPEAVGGDRQFDYRFSWLRDNSLAVSVAALLGRADEARRYLAFLASVFDATDGLPGPVTDVRGGAVPDEREVPSVAGWGGSRPVRVGNSAAEQVQYDALGMVLEAVSVYLQAGGPLHPTTWAMVRRVADQLAQGTLEQSNGIWEFREPRRLVSADIGVWLTLDRAVWIARGWRPWARRRHWKRARREVRDRVLAAIDDDGGLPQSYDDPAGAPRADASALMAVVFGMLKRGDERALRLVEHTLRRLGAGAFLYRYEPGTDDGFHGHEGAFVPVSWWAVAALAIVGQVDEAEARLDRLCAALPRLLAEEADPVDGSGLGNVPLLWSHTEAARALYIVDAARLRRRFGAAGLWAWRLVRYARLRAQFDSRGPEASRA
ncbi:MAG: glycoside hydrolase family 15 protein [Acidimicrobiia bacterium]